MPVEYENLEIEFARCCCGRREVRILESPIDRPRASLSLTDPELAVLRAKIDGYDRSLLANGPLSYEKTRSMAEEIGRDLFGLVATGAVAGTLRESLTLLDYERRERDVGRRLRFSFGQGESYDPELATLPWELICDPEAGGRFLGSEPMTQVARSLEIRRPFKPLAVAGRLRVLAVLASPKDQSPVDLREQELRLRRTIPGLGEKLELRVLERPTLQATIDELTEAERERRPFHVLHFLGHGELTDEGHGALYFERRDRSEEVVRACDLAAYLSGLRNLRLVVLAACSGAKLPRVEGMNPFTGSASALIAANLPAVVAMQFNVSEHAAASFTAAFYEKLGDMCPLDEAVAAGRQAIRSGDGGSFEWATPVLFLRSPDGVVFKPEHRASERERLDSVLPEQSSITLTRTYSGRDTAVTADGPIVGSDVKAKRDLTVNSGNA